MMAFCFKILLRQFNMSAVSFPTKRARSEALALSNPWLLDVNRMRHDGFCCFVAALIFKRFHGIGRAGLFLFCMGAASFAFGMEAAEKADGAPPPRFELDEIVVTAARTETPLNNVPKNVTVITREDIDQAPSNNIVDLLSREAGIQLRSLFGSDKQAVIDIRGMGATAGSSVVVMVDGIRMNPSDMAGVDFSSILLEQIERIEIVRGPGAVIYGDGAVSGVINIITRKGRSKPEGNLYAAYGSYATTDLRASAQGGVQDLSYNISGGYFDSDGYRDNGDLSKKDIAGGADYYWTDALTLSLSGAYHTDDYGLPGPVSLDALNSRTKRVKSDYPDDHGETVDSRFSGGIHVDLDDLGLITIKRGYRQRSNDFVAGYSPLIAEDDQINEIDESIKSFHFLYELDFALWQREHKFQLGVDHQFADYVREEAPGGPRINSRTNQLGVYIHNQWSLSDAFLFQWGYRDNQHKGKFRTDQLVSFDGIQRWVNGTTERSNWHNTAYDLGLTYLFSQAITFYGSYGTSFRTPNTDEIAEAEAGLNPQHGRSWDIGARFRTPQRLELSLTLFHTAIEDEIYYSEINRNYDDTTLRQGLEADVRWYLSDALYLWGNYSYTTAVFEKTGNRIPLVPEHKGSVGIDWSLVENLTLSMTGTYVGQRYDGNDIENDRYASLDPYTVFDGKITYRRKHLKLFAGVNNMFDALYATYAYSERYYSMPGRNMYAGLEWIF